MTPKEEAFATLAKELIKNLKKRNIDGYYFESSAALCEHFKKSLPQDAVISWGGSETIKESGIMELIRKGSYTLIDRSTAKTPQESREIFSRAALSDYYFMSTNAITMDGELVNVDGSGNRVACLLYGPEHVCLIVGRNKIAPSLPSAMERVRNIAAPANTQRLNLETPCHATGRCADCLSPKCICSHTVITRRCGTPGRIQIYLVNEDLGY